ncbi:MAG: Do family serine endopeptidase [Cohaesibacteraceae bacterium]|nr:Do family serine endopeptidase [Cohaesibacteraceae bacterium]MBL4876823.1 Do family serine endopeptidase [Cohaesibacteraceae bacterium]
MSIRPVSRKNILLASVMALGLGMSVASPVYFSSTVSALAEPVHVNAQTPAGFADVVVEVKPAVVSIRVKTEIQTTQGLNDFGGRPEFRDLPKDHPFNRFFKRFDRRGERNDQQRPRPKRRFGVSQGSGFFISADGFIVTNNHVIDKGTEFTITMHDGVEVEAILIGKDARSDLALLKAKTGGDYTYVKFSEVEPRVGDWVVAVGNPFGLGGSVTAGIISARGREIGASLYDDFLQIDAPVNKGNSGGPAFNVNGEVVGVNTAIFSPSGGNVGIAFAIPASTASQIINDLIDDGLVSRGWLGVSLQPITDEIADGLGLDETFGSLVREPQPDSPAAKAGIKSGDAIIEVNGEKIKDSRDLARRIGNMKPGSEVNITVWRDGKKVDVVIKLGTFPTSSSSETKQNEPGKSAPAIKKMMQDFGIELERNPDGDGVLISFVERGSLAAEKGLKAGDIITSIGGKTIRSPKDFGKGIRAARKSDRKRKSVLLRVQTEQGPRFVALPLKRKKG